MLPKINISELLKKAYILIISIPPFLTLVTVIASQIPVVQILGKIILKWRTITRLIWEKLFLVLPFLDFKLSGRQSDFLTLLAVLTFPIIWKSISFPKIEKAFWSLAKYFGIKKGQLKRHVKSENRESISILISFIILLYLTIDFSQDTLYLVIPALVFCGFFWVMFMMSSLFEDNEGIAVKIGVIVASFFAIGFFGILLLSSFQFLNDDLNIFWKLLIGFPVFTIVAALVLSHSMIDFEVPLTALILVFIVILGSYIAGLFDYSLVMLDEIYERLETSSDD